MQVYRISYYPLFLTCNDINYCNKGKGINKINILYSILLKKINEKSPVYSQS